MTEFSAVAGRFQRADDDLNSPSKYSLTSEESHVSANYVEPSSLLDVGQGVETVKV